MDKFKEARIISARAFQLAVGADPTIKPEKGERFEELARRELEEGKVPLKVFKRK